MDRAANTIRGQAQPTKIEKRKGIQEYEKVRPLHHPRYGSYLRR
jgi:hypothetical protein